MLHVNRVREIHGSLVFFYILHTFSNTVKSVTNTFISWGEKTKQANYCELAYFKQINLKSV